MFYALGQLVRHCETGHKKTFGLGETHLGWRTDAEKGVDRVTTPIAQIALAERIEERSALFLSLKKRKGGDRAQYTADTWATILARREVGDSLGEIAEDISIPYGTAKTCSKLARRALREHEHNR